MPIVGLGTDIVEIERIGKALSRTGDAFAERILTKLEFKQYQQTKQKERFVAKRFAAKEAAAKALGTGIAHGITFHDFAISNDVNGRPLLALSGKALERSKQMNIAHSHLSISDERHYAVATVIFES